MHGGIDISMHSLVCHCKMSDSEMSARVHSLLTRSRLKDMFTAIYNIQIITAIISSLREIMATLLVMLMF